MSQIQHTARTQLPVDKILSLLDEGHRQSDVAEIFGTTQPTISRIFRNCQSLHKGTETQICSSCRRHTVTKEHRFLCDWCWKHADTGNPTFSEHTLTI